MAVEIKSVEAGVLKVAYIEKGPKDGLPVFLMHGFPYDIHCYDEVSDILGSHGFRCFIPYLRGYGPTSYLSAETLRSGQQAVLGYDLLAFMDALKVPKAILAGFDWGGRAACIVAALWPERVLGLVTCGGYNIQNIPQSHIPLAPEFERKLWYQYYFHSERGREGLKRNRGELSKLLWKLWSPSWNFTDETFRQTAQSFDNKDFVDTVIHSYRHRYNLVKGDPAVEEFERVLASQPKISVPTIGLDGADDSLHYIGGAAEYSASQFPLLQGKRVIPGVGHNPPQENPGEFSQAIIDLSKSLVS